MKRRLAWAAALGVLPALGIGLWSEWQARESIAQCREQVATLRARREQLAAVGSRVAAFEGRRAARRTIAQVLEGLREAGRQGPSLPLGAIATVPEVSALRIDAIWAQDGYLELSGRAGTTGDVNRAGQALEQRGHLDSFDVWRFDPDGGFALLGRMPEPERGPRR